jgi:hypothetical protein
MTEIPDNIDDSPYRLASGAYRPMILLAVERLCRDVREGGGSAADAIWIGEQTLLELFLRILPAGQVDGHIDFSRDRMLNVWRHRNGDPKTPAPTTNATGTA